MLARVDMVLMGPAEPLKVPITLGVEGGVDRSSGLVGSFLDAMAELP